MSIESAFHKDLALHPGREQVLLVTTTKDMFVDVDGVVQVFPKPPDPKDFIDEDDMREYPEAYEGRDPLPDMYYAELYDHREMTHWLAERKVTEIRSMLLIDRDTGTYYAEAFRADRDFDYDVLFDFLLRAWLEKHYDPFHQAPERLVVPAWVLEAAPELAHLACDFDIALDTPKHGAGGGAVYANHWNDLLHQYHSLPFPFHSLQRRLELSDTNKDGDPVPWNLHGHSEIPFEVLQGIAPLLAAVANVRRAYLWNERPPERGNEDVIEWLTSLCYSVPATGPVVDLDPLWWFPRHLRYLFVDLAPGPITPMRLPEWAGRPIDLTYAINHVLHDLQNDREFHVAEHPGRDPYPHPSREVAPEPRTERSPRLERILQHLEAMRRRGR